MTRPHINYMRNFYCQAQPQHQLQQSPISNSGELGPAQPQLVVHFFNGAILQFKSSISHNFLRLKATFI